MKNKITKYLKPTLIILILSIILFLLLYQFNFTKENISNAFFIVSIITFFVSLIIHTGATKLFIGITYTTKYWFRHKKTKEEYSSYSEFHEERVKEPNKDMIYYIITSLFFILISIFLANI